MKATFDLLHILLLRGWTVAGLEQKDEHGQYQQVLEYRDPNGMSGSEYQCRNDERGFAPLSMFPPAVSNWIRKHVPMTEEPMFRVRDAYGNEFDV